MTLALDAGFFVHALETERVSGDLAHISELPRPARYVLIDGLGHGESAFSAARACLQGFESARSLSIDQAFESAHRACRQGRGVAASMVELDLEAQRARVAGVGNVAVWIFHREGTGSTSRTVPILMPGVLGSAFRKVRVTEVSFHPGDTLLMHSDGVRTTFDRVELAGLRARDSAERIVRQHGKSTDDASCLIAQWVDFDEPQPSAVAESSTKSAPNDVVMMKQIRIAVESDAQIAAFETRSLAGMVGMSNRAQWELSIAVAELANNAVRHGAGGLLSVSHDLTSDEIVIEIADAQRSLDAPHRPGLGVGLEASRRMLDSLEFIRDPGRGTRVVARKRVV